MELNSAEMRKALVNDTLYATLKAETDELDNRMLEYKTKIKTCIQDIIDYRDGVSMNSAKVSEIARRIYEYRVSMKAIHERKQALAETKSELAELGLFTM